MKDGAIVQVGTPEEILTNPKNAYVEKFVAVSDVIKVSDEDLRGLFRTDYPGTTLRESLGLDQPKNQYTQQ